VIDLRAFKKGRRFFKTRAEAEPGLSLGH
jgi:hypothetical protein